jgi:hypothetical protein
MTDSPTQHKDQIPASSFLAVFKDYPATFGVAAVAAALLAFMCLPWLLEAFR